MRPKFIHAKSSSGSSSMAPVRSARTPSRSSRSAPAVPNAAHAQPSVGSSSITRPKSGWHPSSSPSCSRASPRLPYAQPLSGSTAMAGTRRRGPFRSLRLARQDEPGGPTRRRRTHPAPARGRRRPAHLRSRPLPIEPGHAPSRSRLIAAPGRGPGSGRLRHGQVVSVASNRGTRCPGDNRFGIQLQGPFDIDRSCPEVASSGSHLRPSGPPRRLLGASSTIDRDQPKGRRCRRVRISRLHARDSPVVVRLKLDQRREDFDSFVEEVCV